MTASDDSGTKRGADVLRVVNGRDAHATLPNYATSEGDIPGQPLGTPAFPFMQA
jgi:hypothetical protein